MESKGWVISAALAAVVSIFAIAFLAWQVQNITRSLQRLTAMQGETSRETLASLARTEGHLRELKMNVRTPDMKEWLRAIEKPLIRRVDDIVTAAQKRGIEDSLKKWSEKMQLQGQKRWEGLIGTLNKDRETAQRRHQQEERRWQGLMETLQKNRETTQKQYREVVQRLSEEKARALENARQLQEKRDRQVAKLLEQAKQIERERKRQLSDFCTKRPESTICRDL